MEDHFAIADNATFIVGHARSGTSLLRALLDNHPQLVVYPNEMKFFRLTRRPFDAETFLRQSDFRICFDSDYAIPGLDFDAVRADLNGRLRSARNLRDAMLAVVNSYAAVEPSRGPEKERWVEKTPSSHAFAPLLWSWFANCRMIWMVRDPRAVFKSVRAKHPQATVEEFCRSYAAYLNKMRVAQARSPDRMLAVRYEDLVRDTPAAMRCVAGFLGIRYTSDLETASLAGKGNQEASWVPKGVHQRSLNKESPYVRNEEINAVEGLLGREIAEYGYGNPRIQQPRPASLRLKLLAALMLARLGWVYPPVCYLSVHAGSLRRLRGVNHSRRVVRASVRRLSHAE